MRYWKTYIGWMACLAGMLLTACQHDELTAQREEGAAVLRLGVFTEQGTTTRAESPGVESLNENLIQKLDLFLYKMADGTGTGTALKHYTFTGLNAEKTYTVPTQQLTLADLNTLFSPLVNGEQCWAYAVVNYTGTLADGQSIATYKQTIIESAGFADRDHPVQDCFIMDGEFAVALASESNQYVLTGNIPLSRAACKIDLIINSLAVTVEDDNGLHWRPEWNTMSVAFHNGVKKGHLNDDMVREEDMYHPVAADFFNLATELDNTTALRSITPTRMEDDGTTPKMNGDGTEYQAHFTTSVPYYSYPTEWASTANSGRQPYFTLHLNWIREEDNVKTAVSYQIPIGDTRIDKNLKRNMYYQVMVNVAIMGDMEADQVKLEDNSYIVLDWNSTNMIPIDMREMKFLEVKYNDWVINNEASGRVEYASSHNLTTLEVDRLEYIDYGQVTIRKYVYEKVGSTYYETVYNNTTNAVITARHTVSNPFTAYTVTDDDGYVKLTHTLNWSEVYSPRIVRVKVENDAGLSDYITFTINPPIYIEGVQSAGYVFVNGKNSGSATDDNNGGIGNISTLGGGLTNTNHYIVHTTSLAGSKYNYTIGDPRTYPTVNNLTSLNKLTDYYPTLTTGTESMISPVFMVASAYGAYNTYTNLTQAEKRCASYQEDGYPAGRWRVPTAAEIIYMVGLQTDGIIPSLFNFSANDYEGYWSANGKVIGNASGKPELNTAYNNRNTAVRCVYDIWYWGDEHATGTAAQSAIKGDDKTNDELEALNWVNAW